MNIWLDVLIALIKALFFLSCVLTLTSLLTWMERKQSAVMQDRLGANRAPILGVRAFGLPHILSDALTKSAGKIKGFFVRFLFIHV